MSDWLQFWDSPHSIYVSARHKDVHYHQIAQDIAALVRTPNARVLDYGAGEALYAHIVAAASGELLLCEAAPTLRTRMERFFAADPKIRVLTPQKLKELPNHSLDLIILHSVAQYLTNSELDDLLTLFHRLNSVQVGRRWCR